MAASALCRVVGDDEDELLGERSYMLRSALEDIDHGHCNARPEAVADNFSSSKKTQSRSGKLKLHYLKTRLQRKQGGGKEGPSNSKEKKYINYIV